MPNNMLLFLAEQINLMPFYYVQDVYQKSQLRTRSDKRHMIPEVNIISGKASVASVNGARWGGLVRTLSPSAGILGEGAP